MRLCTVFIIVRFTRGPLTCYTFELSSWLWGCQGLNWLGWYWRGLSLSTVPPKSRICDGCNVSFITEQFDSNDWSILYRLLPKTQNYFLRVQEICLAAMLVTWRILKGLFHIINNIILYYQIMMQRSTNYLKKTVSTLLCDAGISACSYTCTYMVKTFICTSGAIKWRKNTFKVF